MRLNAMSGTIWVLDDRCYDPFLELSTNSQNPQRERKKEAKKERETAATTAVILNQKVTFLSCTKGDISKLR